MPPGTQNDQTKLQQSWKAHTPVLQHFQQQIHFRPYLYWHETLGTTLPFDPVHL